MKKYDWDQQKIEQAVKESKSYSDVLRKLNIKLSGNNAETLKRKIECFKIDTSHFTFHPTTQPKITKNVYDYLKENTQVKPYLLKLKLIKSGLKENKCEICGISSWLGKRIVCQLHHINGDNTDNRLENLQILCPNCHSQTDNYCGSANITETLKRYCPECGREIKTKTATLCLSCSIKKRKKKVDLTKDELIATLKKHDGNRCSAGREIGVSETCVRKYIKKYNLPSKSKELKEFLKTH